MLHTLKFDFSKVSFKDQLIKVSEELGEVIKADSGKE